MQVFKMKRTKKFNKEKDTTNKMKETNVLHSLNIKILSSTLILAFF